MRPRPWIIVVAALAFVIVLAMRLPLRWATGFLPPQVKCELPTGSIWRGRCNALSLVNGASPLPLGPVSWDLRGAALLRLHLAGTLRLEGPQLRGTGRFDAGPGHDLDIADLDATAPLDRRLFAMLPSNWTGRLQLKFPRITVRGGRLLQLQGSAEAHDVVAQGPRPDEFGSYALTFSAPPVSGIHHGVLRDLDGPIELGGTLDVKETLDWELDALVKARPAASAQLSRLIEYLGPPDAQGRRRFSATGDF